MGFVHGRRVLVLSARRQSEPTGSALARYSSRAFPAYRFVPGRDPHPTRDVEGHSYGKTETAEEFCLERWRDCETYLYGIDLFNSGYWWEAHEAFEGLWARQADPSLPRAFLQGLIQLAAALLKRHMGHLDAARRLTAKAGSTLDGVDGLCAGVAVGQLIEAVARASDDEALPSPLIVLQGEAARIENDSESATGLRESKPLA